MHNQWSLALLDASSVEEVVILYCRAPDAYSIAQRVDDRQRHHLQRGGVGASRGCVFRFASWAAAPPDELASPSCACTAGIEQTTSKHKWVVGG